MHWVFEINTNNILHLKHNLYGAENRTRRKLDLNTWRVLKRGAGERWRR
jgi:hypothetical protein